MEQRPQPSIAAAPELTLEQRFQRGDRAAFEALARPHLDTVYTLCLRFTNRASDAEDMAQEALIRAMTRHAMYDSAREFRPWLLTIAANLCRDHLRSVWWRRVIPLQRDTEEDPDEPETLTLHAQRDRKVRHALSTLPARYVEALALFYLDGMSYAEMAEITGQQVPALKQRVRRGKERLKEALEKMYPELDLDP